MKLSFIALFLILTLTAFAQKPDDVVATANGHSWAIKDLSSEAQNAAAKFPGNMAAARKQLLSQMVGELLIEAEARARRTSPAILIQAEMRKVKDPTPAEIKAVFDANKDQLGGKTLAQVRPQIVAFLRHDPEDAAVSAYVDGLATKFKGSYPKDINAPGLKPTDIVFAMTGAAITAKQFEDPNRLALFGLEADFYDDLRAETAETVYNQLVMDEAAALKIDSSELIAREVSSKLKEFSDEERNAVQKEFADKLFSKYNVKLLVRRPEAPVQSISVDDDPSRGPANAPVTIVMFSDFQCSACSATHPILQKAMEPYADKIRFVVRDYPLENLHPNAFHAALAANAAAAQGKFFEYVDILYKNQKAQDDASLKKYAADLGLNAARFAVDFSSAKTAAEVRKDMEDGRSYGVSGTPSIFINGRYVREISLESFRNAIESALKK